MHLATTPPLRLQLTTTPVASPMHAVAESQPRFRLEGRGPLSSRTITPESAGATELLRIAPRSMDAVRGVLKLVEHVAGGPARSSSVDLKGIAFSTSAAGLAANTVQAHVDDDEPYKAALAKQTSSARASTLASLATRKQRETAGMLANVTAGWMNIGSTASGAIVGHAAGQTQVPASDLARAIRLLLHESVHVVDTEPANLPEAAMQGVWEALAEARTMSLPNLQAARSTLGLDRVVSDKELQQMLTHRPYAGAERVLAGVMKTAGIAPGGALERQIVASTAHDAVNQLAPRLACQTGHSLADANQALATAFAESMAGAR